MIWLQILKIIAAVIEVITLIVELIYELHK